MAQKTQEASDKCTKPGRKNAALAKLLLGEWKTEKIKKIQRVALGKGEGWRAYLEE